MVIKKYLMMLLFSCFLCVGLSGCFWNLQSTQTSDSDKLSIVTINFAPYDFARQITDGNADITMLLSPGDESLRYEPTPQDILSIEDCDVFIYTGGDSDKWVDRILDALDTSEFTVIRLIDCVDTVEEELVEGMEENSEPTWSHFPKDTDDDETELDEHVWTSPLNAITISQKMAEVFSELDKSNSQTYLSNLESYVAQLEELDSQFTEVVETASRNTIIFGDRFPLRYLADAYGLNYYAAFPGDSLDMKASDDTIAFLSNKVAEEEAPVVFTLELSNENIAQSIAEESNAEVKTFYSCHTLSQEDFDAGLTYIDLMEKNIEVLKEALN